MPRTPEQLQAELIDVYGKQNSARLERKYRNLSKAKEREENNNPDGLPFRRKLYYSYRLAALERNLGIDTSVRRNGESNLGAFLLDQMSKERQNG